MELLGGTDFTRAATEGVPHLRSEAGSSAFHTQYPVKGVPQIPPSVSAPRRQHVRSGEDSIEVHGRGIADKAGRLMVFMTHNTDIDDAWEREGGSAILSRVRAERLRARSM